ncbi:MFS transporter [Leekyejoonella antrihumi]|uniref:MFS transporter n=1 Tax=Leekyejoonella antrihumi TaxID=1660198 RepID=A0A563DUG8_9MICO|nr:MFS transporter [Leekyejoonella antrihumi]TWP33562.1 MFS transporter [Leekyejoonella antrihumi]
MSKAPSTTIPAPTRSKAPWAALFVMVAGAFVDLLDGTIVQVALPSIQHNLDASDADLQWISASYLLAFALMLITSARLGDMFGRKRAFLTGLAAFMLASFAVALSASTGMLIGFRALQGAASALMLPQVLTFIQVQFDERDKPKAFATYGMMLAVASAGGPLVGGLLIEANIAGWDWRTIFLVNVPIGLVALTVGARIIPESRPAIRPRVDPVGLALVGLALVAVFYPLIQGRYLGWPAWSFCMLACAVPLLAAFLVVQVRETHRHGAPLIDLPLFTTRASGVGLLIALLFFGTTSYFFVLTLHLQEGLGYTPLHAGITFLPFSIGTIVGSMVASPIGARLGRGAVMIAAAVMALSLAGMLLVIDRAGADLSGWALALPQGGAGVGFGITSGTLATIILIRVAPERAAAASGVVNTVIQLGSVTAIAIVGAIFFDTLTGRPTTAQFVAATSHSIWYLVAASTACVLLAAALPHDPVAPD